MTECVTLEFLPGVRPVVATAAITREALCTTDRSATKGGSGWLRTMETLNEWECDSSRFDADEVLPPTPRVIRVARDVAAWLRDQGGAAPLRVVPDGDGGVAFEHRDNDESVTIHVHNDGSVEWIQFLKCALVYRQLLPPLRTGT